MHKMLLTARQFARKRASQLTRDELFRRSQDRQHRLQQTASLSPEDRIGEEVTVSLKRMLETMRGEIERSVSNIQTANDTSGKLRGTADNYQSMAVNLGESRKLVRDLKRKDRRDRWFVLGALGIFLAIVGWILIKRLGLEQVAKAPLALWKQSSFVARNRVDNIMEQIQLHPHPGPEHEIKPIFFEKIVPDTTENSYSESELEDANRKLVSKERAEQTNDQEHHSPPSAISEAEQISIQTEAVANADLILEEEKRHVHNDSLVTNDQHSEIELSEGELSDTDSDHEHGHKNEPIENMKSAEQIQPGKMDPEKADLSGEAKQASEQVLGTEQALKNEKVLLEPSGSLIYDSRAKVTATANVDTSATQTLETPLPSDLEVAKPVNNVISNEPSATAPEAPSNKQEHVDHANGDLYYEYTTSSSSSESDEHSTASSDRDEL